MDKNRITKAHRKAKGKWPKLGQLKRDDLPGLAQGLGLTVLVAALFYRSPWALFLGIVIVPYWLGEYKKEKERKLLNKRRIEFKEYMQLIANALQTGYSLEKALLTSEEELKKLFGKESCLGKSIHEMNQMVSMNIQVEKAFEAFARKTGLEEAMSLSEILSFAKRSGGDYGKQIKNTATKIDEKIAVSQEIETLTAQKKLELKVMCIMPMVILMYIAITSFDFIAPLYGNPAGIILMSVCLVMYLSLMRLGKSMVQINV